MRRRPLGRTGILVSPVGMGVLTMGKTQLNLPLDEGAELIRYALSRGINFLDTAQYYETYDYIRAALRGGREQPVVASKSLARSYGDMEAAIEEMRRTLDMDVLDIFLLHEVRGGRDLRDREGAWACLCDCKARGVVRSIGLSTHHVDVALRNAELSESDLLFGLINLESLGIRHGDDPGTKEDMALAILKNHQAGKGFFAMKVLGGGNLTASYLSALNYVAALPGVASMMIGLGTMEEVDRLAEYAEGSIDLHYVPDVKDKRMRVAEGDCEGCGACITRCPNHAIYKNQSGRAEVNHDLCLTCGYCAPVCPVRALILY